MKFKVLCTAPLNRYPEVIKYFHMKFDGEIVEYMSYDDLVDKVHQFSGLIPNARIPVSAEVIENATRLKAIYQPSMGFEHIDVEKLKTKKIKFNALGIDDFRYSLWSTAEHAYQIQFFLHQLVLHTLRVFHEEAAHQLLQVSDQQDEYNPNLNRWIHSN